MRIPRALALLAPAFLTLPSPVAAQTQGDIDITMTSVSENGTIIRRMGDSNFATRGFNAAECAVSDDITTQFAVLNLPSGTTFVDAWLGNGTQDCSTEAARQTGNGRVCVHLAVDPSVTTNTVTVALSDMVDPDDSACESTPQAGATYTLWFFATGSTETTSAVTSAQFGYVSFTMDVEAPAVPTLDSSALSGGSSVSVSWDELANETNPRFRLYVDDTVTTCSDAGALMPGGVAPDDATSEVSAALASVDLSEVPIGGQVVVYVASVDRSDNVSALSSGVCVTKVETVGFCEALEASGEECTNSCAVSVPTSGSPTHVWWLVGCAVALAARRRWRS